MKKIVSVILVVLVLILGIYLSNNFETSTIEVAVPVLMYHHISEDVPADRSSAIITPDNFKSHMIALKDNGYNPIFFDDLIKARKNKLILPENPIIITFDDGYRSNYIHAYPLLKDLNMKANINIVVSTVGKTPGIYPHFTWEKAKEMISSGLIEIGSHTYDLHTSDLYKKDSESKDEYYTRIYDDFLLSRNTIKENLDINTPVFCAPYGLVNDTLIKASKDAKFSVFLSITEPLSDDFDQFIIKRITVTNNDNSKTLLNKINEFYAE